MFKSALSLFIKAARCARLALIGRGARCGVRMDQRSLPIRAERANARRRSPRNGRISCPRFCVFVLGANHRGAVAGECSRELSPYVRPPAVTCSQLSPFDAWRGGSCRARNVLAFRSPSSTVSSLRDRPFFLAGDASFRSVRLADGSAAFDTTCIDDTRRQCRSRGRSRTRRVRVGVSSL